MSFARTSKVVLVLRDLPVRLFSGQLSRNGLFALGHGLTQTLCVFLVYRITILHAGLEWLGIWSLLIACATIARIIDISGSATMARFVATASLETDPFRARDYVHTAIITGFAINAAIGVSFWLAAPLVLPSFISSDHMDQAHVLVPWVIANTILGALAYTPISALDGAQRADRRSIVGATAAAVLLFAGWVLVPRLGIVGLAAAQMLQQATMLVMGWAVLRRHVRGLGWFPWCWRRKIFIEMTGYAARLNAVATMGLLFEPLAKFAFNHSGGPALVALFELASRLVTQFRVLMITTAAPLSPAFAARVGFADPASRRILEQATRISALASAGMTLVILFAAPLVSLILLDRVSPEFLYMNTALTAGWAINTLALPLYFAAHGLGRLLWNFVGAALTAASALVGAFFFVPAFGPTGLIAAIVAGLLASTLALLLGNARALGAADVIWKLRGWLIAAAAMISVLCAASGALVRLCTA